MAAAVNASSVAVSQAPRFVADAIPSAVALELQSQLLAIGLPALALLLLNAVLLLCCAGCQVTGLLTCCARQFSRWVPRRQPAEPEPSAPSKEKAGEEDDSTMPGVKPVAQSDYAVSPGAFRAAVGTTLVLVAATVALFLAWGAAGTRAVRRQLDSSHPAVTAATAIAVAPTTLWLGCVLGLAALLWWRAQQWRAPHLVCGVSGVAVVLTVAAGLLQGYELAVVFGGPYVYLSASWVFLGTNAILAVMAVHQVFAPDPRNTMPGLLAMVATWGREGATSWADAAAATAEAATFTSSASAAASSDAASRWRASADALAATITPAHGARVRREARARGLLLYGCGLVVLVIYCGVNWQLVPAGGIGSGAGSSGDPVGRLLAVITAASVLVLDALAGLLVHGGVLQSPVAVTVVMAASRALLLAFGSRFWLLGTTCVYLLYALTLAYLTVRRAVDRFAAESPVDAHAVADVVSEAGGSDSSVEVADDAEGGEGDGNTASSVIMDLSPASVAALSKPTRRSCIQVIAEPLYLLIALSGAFAALLALVAVVAPPSLPLARVKALDSYHDQYEAGVAAVLAVIILLAVYWYIAVSRAGQWRFGATSAAVLLALEVIMLLSGLGMWVCMCVCGAVWCVNSLALSDFCCCTTASVSPSQQLF